MKQLCKRILTGLLALTLLLSAAGCGGETGGTIAMGRYVERTLPMPDSIHEVLAFRGGDGGTVDMLGYEGGLGEVSLVWYRSADGGENWELQPCPALEAINLVEEELSVFAAAWDEAGRLYLVLGNYENTPQVTVVEKDGTRTDLPVVLPDELFYLSSRGMAVTGAGDLIIDGGEILGRVSGSTGALLNRYPLLEDNWVDGWAMNGDTILMSCNDQLIFYSLEGEQTATMSCAAEDGRITRTTDSYASERVVAPGENGSFYFADASGLYRALPDSSVLEQLTSGSLTSLGAPSFQCIRLTTAGDRLLLLGYEAGSGYVLLAYEYDPDVPTLPEQELSVWSLQDSPLIRQTISAFRDICPDVHVTYRPALDEDGAVTREDALRALNTELAAGRGPDVLLLDGLNVNDYIQKETLADLSELLEPLIQDGTLHPAAARSCAQADGSIPAVPAQIQIPMIHGAGNAPQEIGDLKAVLAWLNAHAGDYNHPLPFTEWEEYLDFFYPVCAPSFTDERGVVDEAGLTDFLSTLSELYALERAHPIDDEAGIGTGFDFGALLWTAGAAGLNVGNLCTFTNLYPAWQTISDRGEGQMDLLFEQDGFLPVSLLGVNAGSAAGPARDFVLAALSDPVQSSPLEDGLPVRLDALTTAAGVPEDVLQVTKEEELPHFATYGTTLVDAEGADVPIWLTVHYPPEEFRMEMLARIQALDTPLLWDGTVLQLIKDNTAALADGSAPLEDVLQPLMEKLALYQAE